MKKGLATNVAGTTLVLVPRGTNEGNQLYPFLRPGSIKTWDQMMERFCVKYYSGEDKVTFQSLQMVGKGPERILPSSSKGLKMFL